MVIVYRRTAAQSETMMRFLLTLVLVILFAGTADARCYADYKAKRDQPLRLHYGVAELRGACNQRAAQSELRDRLSANGWTLLQVMSVFGPDGLDRRKASAGSYYLRY